MSKEQSSNDDTFFKTDIVSMFNSLARELAFLRARVDRTFGMVEDLYSETFDKDLEELRDENDNKVDKYYRNNLENIYKAAISDKEDAERLVNKYFKNKRNTQ